MGKVQLFLRLMIITQAAAASSRRTNYPAEKTRNHSSRKCPHVEQRCLQGSYMRRLEDWLPGTSH